MLTSGTLMNPKHPVYIISKGRWDSRHTSTALEKMNMPYSIVVEEDEYDKYASVIDKDKLLILPKKYIENYDSCTLDQGTGSGPARNFCWEHALENGATSHWLLDDNIKAFGRINRNLYIHVTSGTIFKAAEDFIERYEKVNWIEYYKSLPFNKSALALYEWSPIAEELKTLDRKIVLNSMILKWENVQKDFTKLLNF